MNWIYQMIELFHEIASLMSLKTDCFAKENDVM